MTDLAKIDIFQSGNGKWYFFVKSSHVTSQVGLNLIQIKTIAYWLDVFRHKMNRKKNDRKHFCCPKWLSEKPKRKCRLKNEVLVLNMVQFNLSMLLALVAIGLVFILKLPNHSSILLAITLSLRILSSLPIIVVSFFERCSILALWIQCCVTCGIVQISTMSATLFASVPQSSTIPVLNTILIFFFCYIIQFIV